MDIQCVSEITEYRVTSFSGSFSRHETYDQDVAYVKEALKNVVPLECPQVILHYNGQTATFVLVVTSPGTLKSASKTVIQGSPAYTPEGLTKGEKGSIL